MTKRPTLPALFLSATFLFTACSGGGSSPTSTPSTAPTQVTFTPTPTPTMTPVNGATTSPAATPTANTQAYSCPSTDGTSSVAVGGSTQRTTSGVRHMAGRSKYRATPQTNLLAVTYDLGTLNATRTTLAAREASYGAAFKQELQFGHTGTAVRIVSVNPANASRIAAALRSQPGVKSVESTGERRITTSVTQPYFTIDPYFDGFPTTLPTTNGATPPPATYKVPPYEESAQVPGQWDQHATRLGYAFEYSQPNNGSGVQNANALGSSSVKIAVIDTGADTLQPELQGKTAYQKCYITNPTTNVQSSSNYSTDPTGHGTDTSGIATDAVNNSIGYTGAGGNSVLYSYRVFPTPDDNCTDPNTTDNQCGSDTADIAAAINDAVAQHVNVISMSLGGGDCSSPGVDSDPTERAAIANAIAANIIVVAAAGNNGIPSLSAPACDTGVIAVGASALGDGQPNGTNSIGSANAPIEYVAGYSQYGTPGAAALSSSAWGIVAPGGDPISDMDADNFHWIDNIWTSTPFDSNYAGGCGPDYPGTGASECSVLIAGTSMATPMVAGAAALIIAVNPMYQSPTAMKQLLCSSAYDIGDPHEGCGRLDVEKAMAVAVGDQNQPAAH